MFAHIGTDNREFSTSYLNAVLEYVEAAEAIYLRNFERPLLRLI